MICVPYVYVCICIWRRLILGGDSYFKERPGGSRTKRESKGSPKAVPLWAPRTCSGREASTCGPEGPARASVARPLYLKLLTRHTINRGLDVQKSID